MQNILVGIYGQYDSDTTLKAAINGLYFEAAPQDATLPYAIYTIINGRPEYFFGDLVYELLNIQFNVYASTNSDLQTAYDALIDCYDDATPATDGYDAIIMERDFQQFLMDGLQDEYYRAIVSYDCRYEESAAGEVILLNSENMLISGEQARM